MNSSFSLQWELYETAPHPIFVNIHVFYIHNILMQRLTQNEGFPMKTKRAPKTFGEGISRKLNRKNQLNAMKKQLLRKARARKKETEESAVNP